MTSKEMTKVAEGYIANYQNEVNGEYLEERKKVLSEKIKANDRVTKALSQSSDKLHEFFTL